MDFLASLKEFSDWAVGAFPRAIAKNREIREEIRATVGDLTDDLVTGLRLVTMRLRAAKRIGEDQEFLDYLSKSEEQLFRYFSEFRICADLRNLEDRLNRPFDLPGAAIELGSVPQVRRLISNLENHELLILDMIQAPWQSISTAIDDGEAREIINDRVDSLIKECNRKVGEIKGISRTLLEVM